MAKNVIISGFAVQGLGLILLIIYKLFEWISEFTILIVLGFFMLGALINTIGIIIAMIEKYRALHDKYEKKE